MIFATDDAAATLFSIFALLLIIVIFTRHVTATLIELPSCYACHFDAVFSDTTMMPATLRFHAR